MQFKPMPMLFKTNKTKTNEQKKPKYLAKRITTSMKTSVPNISL